MRSWFDDGSWVVLDGRGDVVAAGQGEAGAPVNPSGAAGIVRQFTDLFNYGVRSALDSRYRTPAAAGVPVTANAAGFSLASPLGLAAVVVGGFLVFSLLKR